MTSFERLSAHEFTRSLLLLVDYLAQAQRSTSRQWASWNINPITSSGNNLIYRATGLLGDFAIKFTIKDYRDRAGREYAALKALEDANLEIAPKPVFLNRTRYAQPVVVQTWLEGKVSTNLPSQADEWLKLLTHLSTAHCVTPATTNVRLRKAVINFVSANEGKRWIKQQLQRIPLNRQPARLQSLLKELDSRRYPLWSAPALGLCRADANILNFVRRRKSWASVDWENSGWGDPAFELADLITHPSYLGVSQRRRHWIINTFCKLRSNDADAAARISVYYELLLTWWAVRFAIFLYEIPRGLDRRLVDHRSDWQLEAQTMYRQYAGLAEASLALRDLRG